MNEMEPREDKSFVFDKKESARLSIPMMIAMIAALAAWLTGLVFMFLKMGNIGLPLWAGATIGMVIVYLVRRNQITLEEVRRAEMLADSRKDDGAKDAPTPEKSEDAPQGGEK